jgi:hypothetical protein
MAEADKITITRTAVVHEGEHIKVTESRELKETEGGWTMGHNGIPCYTFPVIKGREFTAPVASRQLDAHDALVHHFQNPDPVAIAEGESMGIAVPTCFEVSWVDLTIPKPMFPLYRYAINTSHELDRVKKEPWGLSLHDRGIVVIIVTNTLEALAFKNTIDEIINEMERDPSTQRIPLPHGATQAVFWVIPFDAGQRQAEAQRCIDTCAKASCGYRYQPFQTVAFATPRNLNGPPTLAIEVRIQECPESCDLNHMHMRVADF